jgi:hypothetical protein
MVIEKDSASGAWVVVCAAVNKVRGIDREKVIWVPNLCHFIFAPASL